jgi:DNA-binding transcriptional LysR family regulator
MARCKIRRYFRHGLLPQLIAFETVVRLGGVTRAADELALAQPTVSGLLRKLTDTIGEPLLHVGRGRVELTEAGKDVALLCEEVLAAVQRFDERKSRETIPETRELRRPISVPETWAGIPTTMAPWSLVPEPHSPSK